MLTDVLPNADEYCPMLTDADGREVGRVDR